MNSQSLANRCPCYALPINQCTCEFDSPSYELIVNGDEFNTARFPSLDSAIAHAELLKDESHVIDLKIYNYCLPPGLECLLSWSKRDGVWTLPD